MGFLAGLAYLALALIMLSSALKHRQAGWIGGVVFALGLLSLPLWVGLLIWMMERGHE
jgi:hypothetical protein